VNGFDVPVRSVELAKPDGDEEKRGGGGEDVTRSGAKEE